MYTVRHGSIFVRGGNFKFVPPAQRAEVHESYDAARKKQLAAMQEN